MQHSHDTGPDRDSAQATTLQFFALFPTANAIDVFIRGASIWDNG